MGRLLVVLLVLGGCGDAIVSAPDAAGDDAGIETPDAGIETPDAGGGDAGPGEPDAGPDAGPPPADAGPGEPDAGPPITCIDECDLAFVGGCVSNREHWACALADDDPCTDLVVTVCPPEEQCDPVTDTCVCTDACSVDGLVVCDGFYATHRCADHDGDGCLEWGGRVGCDAPATCDRGACTTSCTNECPAAGLVECYLGARSHVCGRHDTDPCLDWSPITDCADGLLCDSSPPAGDPCVACLDGTDCRPEVAVCALGACVPPPGRCTIASDPALPRGVGTALTSTVEVAAGTIRDARLFLGVTGLESPTAGSLDIRLEGPGGIDVSIASCLPLPAFDVHWDVLDGRDAPALATLAGRPAAGSWTLRILPCAADGSARLEAWALCLDL